jgi:hypothetical protein
MLFSFLLALMRLDPSVELIAEFQGI